MDSHFLRIVKMNRKLLLISSSRTHGTGFLEHCSSAIREHLSGVGTVLFVPFALADHEAYAQMVSTAFKAWEIEVDSLHLADDRASAVRDAKAIFIGGGNSFRLLKSLYDCQLIASLQNAVAAGVPYIGSSAGTNMACPTIRTTNDMPIVAPPSLDALGLVPFQINPHYVDPEPESTHQGETREQRLTEYLEENKVPVIGLREGGWLVVQGDTCQLQGDKSARCFQRGSDPTELPVGYRWNLASDLMA